MKNVILILVLFVFQQLYSQNTPSRACVSHVTQNLTFKTNEEGWSWSGVWYFKNKETIDTPCVYNEMRNVTQIDSIGNLKIVVTYKTIDTKIHVTYSANDSNWIWCGNSWTYKGYKVKVFPSEYTKRISRKSRIEDWEVGDLTKMQHEENEVIAEYYCVQSDWAWSENTMNWLYKNKRTDVAPVYKLVKTITNIL